ncbi:hypothetical protein XBO1_2030005 [Xenorhabdus bovienii str. oregonense]|uniref:Uncharacterized protein n=1 Tax=Xenorhabdus bovienii str. oregonense TaxID=1398202 RepID=A0A077NUB2_XENBV|nr:hypothetical protein XBO1_2030005 [Xenorhabdus bovienii str. oregonense]
MMRYRALRLPERKAGDCGTVGRKLLSLKGRNLTFDIWVIPYVLDGLNSSPPTVVISTLVA